MKESTIENMINQCNSKGRSHDHKGKKVLNICENISAAKPYINYEYNVKLNEYTKNKAMYDAEAIDRLKIMHQYITDAMNILLSAGGFSDKKFSIAIAKSHGKSSNGKYYTFFYRFIVNGAFMFKSTYDARQLVDIIDSISKHPEITKHIDTSCYGKSPTDIQQIKTVFSYDTIKG